MVQTIRNMTPILEEIINTCIYMYRGAVYQYVISESEMKISIGVNINNTHICVYNITTYPPKLIENINIQGNEGFIEWAILRTI